jgi:GDP-4-dehydro-6-deoxy-D-mannose reductase
MTRRALVTGASGFVGPYLVERLRKTGYEVVAAGGPHENDPSFLPIDLSDPQTLNAAFDIAGPDVVFHLAAQSFIPRSIASPQETYDANVLGTARMLQALRQWRDRTKSDTRFVFAGSAEVYGAQPGAAGPIREDAPLHPANPYAASKAAAEAIVAGEAQTFGINAVITRAFNHIGPGQNMHFVVPSFAAQLAAIAAGGDAVLHVGNLEAKRDFLDVRDVVEAYIAIAEHGRCGEIYNVCSGVAIAIRDVLAELIRIAHVPVEIREDTDRMRPADVPILCGSNEKLRAATGWSPRISLRRSLQDIYSSAQMHAAL